MPEEKEAERQSVVTESRAVLEGLRVVEAGQGRVVAFCGKLLATLGADVLKLEPEEGDPLRHFGPYVGESGPERSIPFLFLNTGKRSQTWTNNARERMERLVELVASADVLLLDGGTGGDILDVYSLRAANPGLIVVQLSPFGESGPHAGWQSSDIIQYAMSCWLHSTGSPLREPLALWGGLADALPAVAAATATMMALHERGVGGHGQVVEVSQQEVLGLCNGYAPLAASYTGETRTRSGMPFPMTIVSAKANGWLGINVLTQAQWETLCAYAGLTDLLEDERFAEPLGRFEHSAEITDRFIEWASAKSSEEVFHGGQQWRVPFGYVPHLVDVTKLPQHVDRQFFEVVEHPSAGRFEYPRLPFLGVSARPLRPAPLLGEHDDEPVHEAGVFQVPPLRDVGAATDERRGPLRDVRIIDLSMWWSAPLSTELFALMGAEVIKVESIQRIDGWRLAVQTMPELTHEGSSVFNGVNLNKQDITLDLSREEGHRELRKLVERADVLVENYSSRVMENLGLTDEVLREWNPELNILSMPGFGISGAWKDYVGFAPTIEQVSGLPRLSGYEDGPPALAGNAIADPTAGLSGGLALIAALIEYQRTGVPQRVDLSQLESLTALLGEALLERQATDAPLRRFGNRDRRFAPQGCYPCQGDDQWAAITARSAEEWWALCEVIGRDDLRDEDGLAGLEGRWAVHDRIDEAVAAWTVGKTKMEVSEVLQARGVPAAAVLDPLEFGADTHLNERGYFVKLERPVVGKHPHIGLPFHFSETPGSVFRASPTLGQDNVQVLSGILGLGEDEIARLEESQIIGTEPL